MAAGVDHTRSVMDAILSAPTESYSAFCQSLDLAKPGINAQDTSDALASLHKLALALGVVEGDAAQDDLSNASNEVDELVEEEIELGSGSTREATKSPSHVRLRLDNFVDDEAISDESDAQDAVWLDVPSAGLPPAATPFVASVAWCAVPAASPCPPAPPDEVFGDEELAQLVQMQPAEPPAGGRGGRRAETAARLRSELRALVEEGAAFPRTEHWDGHGEAGTGGWGLGVKQPNSLAGRGCANSETAGADAIPPAASMPASPSMARDASSATPPAFTALPTFTASSFCERATYVRWLATMHSAVPEAKVAEARVPKASAGAAEAVRAVVLARNIDLPAMAARARQAEGEEQGGLGSALVEPFFIDPSFDYDAVEELTVRFSVERARVEGEFYDVL